MPQNGRSFLLESRNVVYLNVQTTQLHNASGQKLNTLPRVSEATGNGRKLYLRIPTCMSSRLLLAKTAIT